jgi:hypothetical protein
MIYILDIQVFILNRSILVKELAYYCMETQIRNVYHFTAPILFWEPSPKNTNVIRYFESCVHGIPWNLGYVSSSELVNVLKFKPKDKIMVNGRWKKDYIMSLVGDTCEVCDMSSLIREQNFSLNVDTVFCISSFHSSQSRCAVNNVKYFAQCLKQYETCHGAYSEIVTSCNNC